jgi:hypothetical protein
LAPLRAAAGAHLIVVVLIDPVVVPHPVSVLVAVHRHVVAERAALPHGIDSDRYIPSSLVLVITVAVGRQRQLRFFKSPISK